MLEWNAVITVHEEGYDEARRVLERFGRVERTDYFNVLVMQVPDYRHLMEELLEQGGQDPASLRSLARVVPVIQTFVFQSPAEFEEKARTAATAWLPALGGKSFHVRMHRRGFKGKLSGMEEEQLLDAYLMEALALAGNQGRITFEEPDAIIAVETLGGRAGLSLWNRADLNRYPLLHLD